MFDLLAKFDIIARVHLLAAMYWTGAVMFLALVASPLVERIRPPSFQRTFARTLWKKAHLSMWIAIALLLVTGALLGRASGQLSPAKLNLAFLREPMGIKLALVGAMVVLSLMHDMFLGYGARLRDPTASTDPPGVVGMIIPAALAVGAAVIAMLSFSLRP